MSGAGPVRLTLSAGRGPVECAWAVGRLAVRLERDAAARGVAVTRLRSVPGPEPDTYLSMLLALRGDRAPAVAESWTGTVCWQAASPYRPGHRRKNWYVTVRPDEPDPAVQEFAEQDVDLVACRTGGPGGQHRNKASTAVRAVHRPTGIVVVVDDERHLAANRRLALDLLRRRVAEENAAAEDAATTARWAVHDQLVRGDPVRIERPVGIERPAR